MDIGERIKFCRKHRGMTQDRLAEETGFIPFQFVNMKREKWFPNRNRSNA